MNPRWIAFLLLLLPFLAVSAEEPVVRKYTVMLAGNKAGSESVERLGNTLKIAYEYNDRGRGPKLAGQIKLNDAGLPVDLKIEGVDYFKGPMTEQFWWIDGKAVWKNKAENGEKQVQSGAFYSSFSGLPHEIGLLARALTQAPSGKLALLPEGEVRIEKIGSRTVSMGGKQIKVVHYALQGLEFVPTQIWLDEEGNYFASAGSWFAIILEGWESVLPELTSVQDEFQAKHSSHLAEKLAKRPSGAYVFRNANVFDSEAGVVHPGWTVVVSGNKILRAGPKAEIPAPDGATIVDATGKTLLPGLWDMHVHLSDSDGPIHLAAGVTSVRDLANDTDKLLQLIKSYDSFAAIGPRVSKAGFIDGPGPYQGPSKVLVATEQEARAAVNKYADLGYVQIKIYSSLKPELVPFIIEEAHKRGLRVSGHIPAFMTAEQLVKMGLDEIQHENFLVLNFLKDVPDTRTPARFTAVADRAAELDISSEPVRSFIALLKEKKTVLDPTVNVFEAMFTDRPGTISASFAPMANRLPSQIRRGLLGGGLPVPEGKDQRYRDSWKTMLRYLKALYDAQITIVPGTDSLAGFALHRELELYAEAGIPPAEVLRIATIVPARVLKLDSKLGSITPGKLADLVLVDGDPSKNISDIRKVRIVMKDGVPFAADDLCAAVGILP